MTYKSYLCLMYIVINTAPQRLLRLANIECIQCALHLYQQAARTGQGRTLSAADMPTSAHMYHSTLQEQSCNKPRYIRALAGSCLHLCQAILGPRPLVCVPLVASGISLVRLLNGCHFMTIELQHPLRRATSSFRASWVSAWCRRAFGGLGSTGAGRRLLLVSGPASSA